MTDSMVERVARALCDDTMKRWRSPVFMKSEPWKEFIPAARGAIEAMRVPTEAMLEAGFHEIKPDGLPADKGDAAACFAVMIDAALKE